MWPATGLETRPTIHDPTLIEKSLLWEGPRCVVFFLSMDVSLDLIGIGLADRECSVPALPFELAIQLSLLLDPTARIRLEQTHGIRESKRRMCLQQPMHMVFNTTRRERE